MLSISIAYEHSYLYSTFNRDPELNVACRSRRFLRNRSKKQFPRAPAPRGKNIGDLKELLVRCSVRGFIRHL